MAAKAKAEKKDKQVSQKEEESILSLARTRFELGRTADNDNRKEAKDDLLFLLGKQWPEDLEQERKGENRPCLVMDKLNEKVRQVTGDQRQNRPGIHVIPFDDKADPETAEIFEGLIRNIESASDAEVAYDMAAESAVRCGRGFIEVITEYCNEKNFDQDIKIKRVANSFSVTWDPFSQELDFSDAKFLFVSKLIDRDEYKAENPGKTPVDFEETKETNLNHWIEGEKKVRVANYWLKVPDESRWKTIYELENGKIVEKKPKEWKRSRQIRPEKIVCYKIDGKNILKTYDWAGKYFPIIPVWGDELNIEGIRYLRGLIRLAKDPQKMHNYFESMITEAISLQPKVPWLIPAESIEGHEKYWQNANKSNLPYLPYNAKPGVPAPTRTEPAAFSPALAERTKTNAEHIKSATGIYDASLGSRSNETSGVAIRERKIEGDTSTFLFMDNLARADRHMGRVLIDLIPKVLDTKRVERILGIDGTPKQEKINNAGTGTKEVKDKEGNVIEKIYDLSVGKYDVAVTVGPSYTTKRQEASDQMLQIVQSLPDTFRVIGDLVVQMLDFDKAEEMAERLKFLHPPELRAELEAEKAEEEAKEEGGNGKEPAEDMQTLAGLQEMLGAEQGGMPGQEAMAAPPPDPAAEIKVAQEQEKLKKMQYETEIARIKKEQEEENLQKVIASADKEKQEAIRAQLKKTAEMHQAGVSEDRTLAELEVPYEE